MLGVDLESVVWCLVASMVWAPFVYVAASRFDRARGATTSELLWLAALFLAALPTVVAPALAAAGVSLRPQIEAADMIVVADMARTPAPDVALAPAPALSTISLATLIDAGGLLYIYGVLLAFGVWLTRAVLFAAHVQHARAVDFPELFYALEDWRRRLGVAAKVRIRASDAVSSVCVYGVFRPVIIIPSTLNARVSFDDLVMMGAHELAHVRRGDGAFFTVCSFARIFFWFNPFVKRIAARAELAAEQGADSLVINGGADRRAYAACFVEGLRFAAERAQLTRVAVPSFTPFDRKSRRERLDAILSGETTASRQPSKLLIATMASIAAALAFAQAAFAVNPDHIKTNKPAFAQLPVDGPITLAYGQPADILGSDRRVHEGVDIAAAAGTLVHAPAAGVVVEATDVYQGKPSWGKVVVIRHRDGLTTRYAHLGSYAVKKGQRIEAGAVIGEVGATGDVSGPHLHYETLIDDERVDPTLAANLRKQTNAIKPAAPLPATDPAPWPDPAVAPTPTPDAVYAPELAGAPEPAVAPDPAPPAELAGFAISGPDTVVKFRSSDGTMAYTIKAGEGFDYAFENAMSADERKRLQRSLKAMRKEIEKAKKDHINAMASMRLAPPNLEFKDFELKNFELGDLKFDEVDLGDMDIDPEQFAELGAKARAMAHEAATRWQADHDRAMRDAERAEREAERETERAEREMEVAERALAREEARREREEARLEREELQREARLQREEELRERAQEIAEAERELQLEREELERHLAMRRAEIERQKAELLRQESERLADRE